MRAAGDGWHSHQTVSGKGDPGVLLHLGLAEEVGWMPGCLDW